MLFSNLGCPVAVADRNGHLVACLPWGDAELGFFQDHSGWNRRGARAFWRAEREAREARLRLTE